MVEVEQNWKWNQMTSLIRLRCSQCRKTEHIAHFRTTIFPAEDIILIAGYEGASVCQNIVLGWLNG
jgi:hypothetical protein